MGRDKLLMRDAAGVSVVEHSAAALRDLPAVIAVTTGPRADAVRQACPQARIVTAPEGSPQSASLRAGCAAVPAESEAVLIALGDMPLVSASLVAALRAAWRPGAIVAPVSGGARGNPVLWCRRYLPEMMAATGDAGARALILRHAQALIAVPWEAAAIFSDLDTPEDAARLGFT